MPPLAVGAEDVEDEATIDEADEADESVKADDADEAVETDEAVDPPSGRLGVEQAPSSGVIRTRPALPAPKCNN